MIDKEAIISEFTKKFPIEPGLFWTPSKSEIISWLLTTLTEIEREHKRDVVKAKIEGALSIYRSDITTENYIAELQKELGEETQ